MMRTAARHRLTRLLTTALVGGLAFLLGPVLPAFAATGAVDTDSNNGVTIRSGNAIGFASVGVQPDGPVDIDCQLYGEPITGKFGRSLTWDHLPGKGYITDSYVNTGSDGLVAPLCTTNPRADKALSWFSSRLGSTAYEGYCELAVESSFGKSGVYPSAIANWNDMVARGMAHAGDLQPPKGALVFWNTWAHAHVGVASGDGTFYATSVNAIGHATLPYYSNYLGWAWPNF